MAVNSIFDTRADGGLAGSSLRNEAADYLRSICGNAEIEVMRQGKKVDVLCRVTEFGKATELFVEVKDYGRNLTREQVARIWADYEPVLDASRSSKLFLVTRSGLSSSGQESVDSRNRMYHQTIWEMEDAAFALPPYVRAQVNAFDQDGLSSYYIPARAAGGVWRGARPQPGDRRPAAVDDRRGMDRDRRYHAARHPWRLRSREE